MACAPLLTEDDLLRFRTKPCLRLAQGSCSFGLDRCQYCHSSVWTRRPPFFPLGVYHQQRNSGRDRHQATAPLLRYLPVACSNVVVADGSITAVPCPRGQNCPFSHSRDEIVYHPLLYKTEECEDYETSRCGVYYCWKTHSAQERRKPLKLKLGLLKGIEVQVFYPGITVVQLNCSAQKYTFGGGKPSEALRGCIGGRGKTVPRRSRGEHSKRDWQQVATSCVLPSRSLMKIPGRPSSSTAGTLASLYGASPPAQARQPPPPPGRSSPFAYDHMDAAWDDRRDIIDSSALMEFVTAETSVRLAGFQDIENAIRGSVDVAGSETYSRTVAEALRRSKVTAAGPSPELFGRAPPTGDNESGGPCATVGGTAALIAMMMLQANRVLAKKGQTAVEEFRVEESCGKKLASCPSEQGAAEGDVLAYLGSAVISPSPYSSTVHGDFDDCAEVRQLAADQSYAVTRANSDGELPLSADFRRSQQGSEQSYSRSLSTSRKSADSTCEAMSVVPGSCYKHGVTEDERAPTLTCCGATWIKRACESGTQAWSDASSDDAAAQAPPPRPRSPVLGPSTGTRTGLPVARRDSDAADEAEQLVPHLKPPGTNALADSRGESVAEVARLPFHLPVFSDRGNESEGREEGNEAERSRSQLCQSERRSACPMSRASNGMVGTEELSRVQDSLARQAARGAAVSTVSHSGSFTRGKLDSGGTGEVDDCRGCFEETGERLRQAVDALDFIKEGQAGELRKDLLMSVAKELLKLVACGEPQSASQTQAHAWYPTGLPLETLAPVRTNDDTGEHGVLMTGLLPASSGASDAGRPWSSPVRKRLDGPSAVTGPPDDTLWW